MDKKSEHKSKHCKLLKRMHGRKFQDIGFGDDFLIHDAKSITIRKNGQIGLHQNENLCVLVTQKTLSTE